MASGPAVGWSRRRLAAGMLGLPLAARAEASVRIGLTPVFLASDVHLLELLAGYLEARLSRRIEFVKRRTYQEITLLLLTGQLDAAWICGFPFVQYQEQLELVAVPLWRGEPLYQSYLIVNQRQTATGIEALRGTIHAFSDPDSNSGWLVTAALLASQGERPASFFRSFFFAYGHPNVIRAVARGLADGGSVDGYVFDVIALTRPESVKGVRVLRRSEKLGFPPIACRRAEAGTVVVQALRRALLDMRADPRGREILAILHLDGFVPGGRDLFAGIARKRHQLEGRA